MSFESPVTILFDTNGTELSVTASQSGSFQDGTAGGLLVMGSSSQGAQFLSLSSNGSLFVTGAVEAQLTPNTPVAQGDSGTVTDGWYVRITDGTQVIGDSSSTPLWITGAVDVINPVDVAGLTFNGDNLLVQISGANTLSGALVITGSVVLGDQPIEVTGTVATLPRKCPNTSVTGVAASTANFTVLAANGNRCGGTFFMEGPANAYIKLGSGASTTSFTVKVGNFGYFEIPANYTGPVDVVFDKNSPSAVLYATEITE